MENNVDSGRNKSKVMVKRNQKKFRVLYKNLEQNLHDIIKIKCFINFLQVS